MPIVASYNIHSCVGTDGCLAPNRIAAVIRELNADVVALQEVDAQHRIDGYLDQWAFLAEELGYFCVPGISLRTHRREYGNALLTRGPVQEVRLHDLSVGRREPRGAIDIDLALNGGIIRILATHLGLRRAERRLQISSLLRILASGSKATGIVLLGDINEWQPGSRNLRLLRRQFHPARAPATFPALRPLLALDRILAAGEVRLRDVTAHGSMLARMASDHLPIRAALHWVTSPGVTGPGVTIQGVTGPDGI
jgi:endonuclease/exonuclease/phosphatase family metal-dependent hydrolase